MTNKELIAKIKAEIERLYDKATRSDGEYRNGAQHALITLKDFIESLEKEQPEVDLEKEVESLFENEDWRCLEDMNAKLFARHFYELGKNAK